jgi:D-erythronate 2-dehydrogenase
MPQSSYGTQKLVCEYLIGDCTRKNFVRGRSVRLMTVSVRPGRPNGAASSFLSGVVTEPLSDSPTTVLAHPDDEVAISSPSHTVAGLLRAASATDDEWGNRPLNLPSLRTAVGDMIAEVCRRSPTAAQLITWREDPAIRRIVQSCRAASTCHARRTWVCCRTARSPRSSMSSSAIAVPGRSEGATT